MKARTGKSTPATMAASIGKKSKRLGEAVVDAVARTWRDTCPPGTMIPENGTWQTARTNSSVESCWNRLWVALTVQAYRPDAAIRPESGRLSGSSRPGSGRKSAAATARLSPSDDLVLLPTLLSASTRPAFQPAPSSTVRLTHQWDRLWTSLLLLGDRQSAKSRPIRQGVRA